MCGARRSEPSFNRSAKPCVSRITMPSTASLPSAARTVNEITSKTGVPARLPAGLLVGPSAPVTAVSRPRTTTSIPSTAPSDGIAAPRSVRCSALDARVSTRAVMGSAPVRSTMPRAVSSDSPASFSRVGSGTAFGGAGAGAGAGADADGVDIADAPLPRAPESVAVRSRGAPHAPAIMSAIATPASEPASHRRTTIIAASRSRLAAATTARHHPAPAPPRSAEEAPSRKARSTRALHHASH